MQFSETATRWLQSVGFEPWVLQVFLVVFGTLLLNFVLKRVFDRIQRGLGRTRTVWDDSFFTAVRKPVRAGMWVLGISFAAEIAGEQTDAALFEIIEPLREVAIIAIVAWFLTRFIRIGERDYVAEKTRKGEEFDRTTLDAIAKLLRLSVLITATLVVLQTLGFSVSGVLAFGGVGGIAVGFAAKDLLANFFGGLMIYLDRPFAVGDWNSVPDREIEGTVEKIGWRLTVIRCFNSRPLYIPNSTFTSIAVVNPSRMRNRDIWETIGIRYEDAHVMADVVRDVTEMLRAHPGIDTERTLMVNFNKFGPSSLDFFVYCFTKTTAWAEFHGVKQDVLLKILEIIHGHGADVAFPTTTVHLEGGPSPRGARTRLNRNLRLRHRV